MSKYLVRVELYQPGDSDYTELHEAMETKGFRRKIIGDDGTWYALPTAEYSISTDEGGDAVLEKADSAADTTGLDHAVTVVKYSNAWFVGLKKKK